MTLYGLPTCSLCAAALKAFAAADIAVTFRDIRADPLTAEEWAPLIHEFGSTLIDRKSPAYRSLSAFLRESDTDAQLLANPVLMARPVITDGTRFTLGWDAPQQAAWGL
ncbi:MAG: hypothetical protein GC146_04190 [Limimaricola sp.]|uniref:arsenate reductase family protein n=1 Tax=Limimaricola sp. TaxID=2211665 RepID=UPI001E13FE20|nr:ArsC/Spx/MgsR family protein [Limimaricola sp.]MBI1416402.1 hypothetical protein [Limimaricola sp.]